jgi:nucleoside triphosphate diphosphatase
MKDKINEIVHSIDRLEVLMDVLREQCPWDREQTLQSLRTYTLEEVHEVIEAIDHEDWQSLKVELGDLLLQIVFYARIAKENGKFSLHDIGDTIVEKMIRRHPHVFEQAQSDDLSRQWEELKRVEHTERTSLMDGIPPLPALKYAQKMQQRAARVGFDWTQASDVLEKMHEELAELEAEVRDPAPSPERMEDEFGDVLFSLVNLGRKIGLDAELALMRTNRKFSVRFRKMEELAESGLAGLSLTQQEAIYRQAKSELDKR